MGGPAKVVTNFVEDTSKTLTKITQPIEKAVTAGVEDTSKNLTNVLQPVEKVVTAVSQDPKALAAIAFAVAAPYAAASLAPYLSGLGAYAGVAAQAITNITIAVAQGVPIEKATENALINVAVSGATGAVQQQIGKVISSPGVTNAITSTVSSGLATAAKGGSQADVEKAMTAGLAGSTASTIYKEAVDASSDVISKAVGGATAGAVTGGTEGAVVGGLSSAAGALGADLAKPTAKPADTAALPAEQVAATPSGGPTAEDLTKLAQESAKLIGPAEPPTASLNTGVVSDAGSPAPIDATINIPPSTVAGLDITQDQSQAETERLARLNQQATTPAAVEPTQGAYLPASTIDQQILDLINPPAVEPTPTPATVSEPIQPAPVAELYSGSMPDESAAETERLARLNQQTSTPTPDIAPGVSPELIPAPVAEGYSTSMPDQSPAETARLARQEAKAAETADVPAVEITPSTDTGLIDTPPVSDTDRQILDLISEKPTEDQSDAETERLARKEAELAGAEKGAYLPDSGTDTKTTTYKPDIFTTTYLSPKTRTAASPTSALGSALGTTGLTSYRGAGEIEGAGTGKARRKVWNEESLKLKDALGV